MIFIKENSEKGTTLFTFEKKHHSPNEPASYDLVNRSTFVVFTNSTLGLEALIKGIKGVAFPPEQFPIEDHEKNFLRADRSGVKILIRNTREIFKSDKRI